MLSEQPITPFRLLVVTTALIFIADVFVMFVILVLPPLTRPAEALVDGFLLAILIFPTLYFLLFRPLLAMARAREQATRAMQSYAKLWDTEAGETMPFEHAPEAYYLCDLKGSLLDGNKAAEELFGCSRDELVGKTFFELKLLSWGQMLKVAALLTRSALGRATGPNEFSLSRNDGEQVPGEIATFPVRMQDRKLVLGVVHDITARRQAEEVLRESRRRFRDLASLLPQSVWEMDAGGHFTFANHQALESHGYSPEDIVEPLHVGQLFSVEDRDRVEDDVQRILDGENLGGVEYKALRKDGSTFPVLMYAAPVVRDSQVVGLRGVTVDITERKQAETALMESEGRFRSLAESASDAIVSVDSNGGVIHWNSAAESVFGYSVDEVIGKPLVSLLPQGLRKSCGNVLAQIALGEDAEALGQTIEVTGLRRDGTEFPLELSLSSWKTPEGTFYTGIARDITERKRTEEMLRKSMVAAENASLAKTEFLTRMSHEIRTPVHGAMGMIDLALDTHLVPEQHEYLSVARSSVESLLAIINDVLDFSKIGARHLTLEEAPFDLRSTIELAVDMVALRAYKKGLEVLCHIPPEVPTALVGDAGRLRQILVNLVGNAVKFTAQGEVTVAVEAKAVHGAEVELHFYVRDTGIGIPDDKLDIIFEGFRQADGSTTRKYGGTGLGLTISQQLVELMGGHIFVESELGMGSTFHFDVWLTRQAPAEQTPLLPAVLPDVRGTRALVIDDNATNRIILRELLSDWGAEVTEAEDGPAALHQMEKAREGSRTFRLVLLDRAMPGMDGFAVARQICADPALKNAIVMMLSPDNVIDDAPRCRDMGISCYVVKPVKQAALLDAVMTVLGTAAEVQPRPFQAATGSVGGPCLRILLAEDNVAGQLVARRRLEHEGHEVRVASNGFEALQVLQEDEFDLVLMDVEMPEMNGLEATRVIRRMEAGSGGHIPIIAMTAYAMAEDREKCLEAGMDSYVSKPVNHKDLFREISRLVLPPLEHQSTPVDIDAALEATGGDRELLEEVVSLFLEEDYPRQLKELKEGIDRQDAPAVKAAAHGIKGGVNSFGGHGAGAIAQQLQEMGRAGNLAGAEALLAELEKEVARFGEFYQWREPVSEGPPAVR